MKKVIAAGAALLMVGSIASAAYAEVNLSGDARVRFVYKDTYDFGNTHWDDTLQKNVPDTPDVNYFDSRIRIRIDGKAKGGAFIKARLRMDDFRWDGQGWDAYKEGKNIWVDYGYVGVPVGPVTLLGGFVNWDVTKFFQWDDRPTVAAINYKNDIVDIYGLYVIEDDSPNYLDNLDDNNMRAYGIYAKAKINDDWSVLAYGLYNDDQRDWTENDAGELVSRNGQDNSGFLGTLHVDGNVAGIALQGEVAYKASDVQATQDDGWGLYAQASYAIGAMTPSLSIGATWNSYTADGDFGWLMIGDIEPIGVIKNVGGYGQDWFWVAPTVDYAVSERLKLTGNFVYVNVDTNDDTPLDSDRLAKLYEISGQAVYTVSEGADLMLGMGYLKPDFDGRLNGAGVQDDGAFGLMAKMSLKF